MTIKDPLALTMETAEAQLGAHEVGTNWGPAVKMYLLAANITVPASWCAAYVNWCAEVSYKVLGLVSPLEKVPLQGYVQSYVDYGKKHGWVVPTKEAQPGDLICIYHKSLKRYGHIGFVRGWTEDRKRILTIEGNANNDGSREGVAVVHHERTPTRNILILRWART